MVFIFICVSFFCFVYYPYWIDPRKISSLRLSLFVCLCLCVYACLELKTIIVTLFRFWWWLLSLFLLLKFQDNFLKWMNEDNFSCLNKFLFKFYIISKFVHTSDTFYYYFNFIFVCLSYLQTWKQFTIIDWLVVGIFFYFCS